MKSNLYFFTTFLFLILSLFYDCYPQEIHLSTAEKHNERGFSTSTSFVLDGNEVISDFDGNFSWVFVSKFDLPNGLDHNITLTFNANVEHRVFAKDGAHRKSGYSVNSPSWIIGVKGFAVQTLNFETNYYAHKGNDIYSTSNLYGEEIPLVIPGYHYTNRNTALNTEEGFLESDFIEILKADGSKITLYNGENTFYTGIYFEGNFESVGYAYVALRQGHLHLRRMWYKPGDGLTYYFEEEMIEYNEKDALDFTKTDPRAMYLKSIISPVGDTVYIQYAHPYENTYSLGRKLFTGTSTNIRIHSGGAQNSSLSYLNFEFDPGIGNRLVYFTLDNKLESSFDRTTFQVSTSGSPVFSTSRNSDPAYTRNKSLIKIVDILGRINTIQYDNHTRKYQNSYNLSFTQANYLPKTINYYTGKKTQIEYRIPVIDLYDYNFVLQNGCNGTINFSNQGILNETYRDDFTNFMVKKRTLSDKFDGSTYQVIEENYNYIWGDGNNYFDFCLTEVNDIKTTITKIRKSVGNSSADIINVTKTFNKYRVKYRPWHSEDFSSTIKILSERKESSGEILEKLYSWDKGTLSNYYFDGTFWLSSYEEKQIKSGTSSSKIDSFSYTPFTLWQNYISEEMKKIKQVEVKIDEFQFSEETKYRTNFIPSDLHNTEAFFMINLPEYEKNYSGSFLKSKISYTYYNSGQKIGKLEKIINNTSSRTTQKTIGYYTAQDGVFYNGLPKSETYSNGVTIKFSYPYWFTNPLDSIKYRIRDSVYARVVTNNGSKEYKYFHAKHYQTKPFKTEMIYDNNSDTLKTWTSYDKRGNLQFEVDINGNYSEYKYDVGGRITRAKFPGSFYSEGQIENDTSYILQNYDSIAETQLSIHYNGSLYYSLRKTRYESDGPPDLPEDPQIEEGAGSGRGDPEGGEGGGGGGQFVNDNYDFYVFFPNSFCIDNINAINEAIFSIKATSYDVSTGQNLNFRLSGVTQDFNVGIQNYQTCGHKTVTFQEETLMSIDVSGIIQSCINADKDLYGFKLSAYFDGMGEAYKELRFGYDTIPTFSVSYEVFNVEESNARSSVLFTYDYINNKVDVIKRFNHDPQNGSKIFTKLEYDSFGQLRKTLIQNSSGLFDLKKETKYNYLGLKNDEKDGENRELYYSYDYFSRIDTLYYYDANPSSPNQTFEYSPLNNGNQYELIIIEDEEDKTTKVYYLKNGLVDKEEKVDGSNTLITDYTYDNIQRLTEVTPPKGVNYKTTFMYDDLGNISQKTSPDEGTVKFQYDKYGNLRFSLNSAAPVNEKALMFTKYDQFNRPLATGLLVSTYTFDLMDPDLDYSTTHGSIPHFENLETDTANFVVVNMYDKFERTGIFSDITVGYGAFVINNHNTYHHKGKLTATAFRDKVGDSWSYKLYGYDELGRCRIVQVYFNDGSQYKKVTNEYDNLGNLVKQSVNYQFYWWYDYDAQGRLQIAWSSIHDSKTTARLDAVYYYNKADQVIKISYQLEDNYKLKQTYSYNNRGWLSNTGTELYHIVHEEEILVEGPPLFAENLTYFDNGNVNTQTVTNNVSGGWPVLNFTYSYDELNRLTNSTCSQNGNFSENYYYDEGGNFKHKARYSHLFHYFYDEPGTNKLSRITTSGQTKNFTYDYRGNMIYDGLKNITISDYDRRNLPLKMTKGTDDYYYNYDDGGNRINKKAGTTNEYYLRDYTGRELLVYDNNTGRLKMVNLFGNGLIGRADVFWTADTCYDESGNPSTCYTRQDEIYYYLKDHLGSIRATIDRTGEVVAAQDYYPFGEVIQGRSFITGGLNEKYKFTEKERDTETNYDYFGARFYDSELGRWLSVDPLADKYPSWSPYSYTLNNPLRFIDPDGLEPNKKQSGTWQQIRAVIVNHLKNGGGLQSLRYTSGDATGKQVGPFGGSNGVRYLHTKNRGWVDMAHFMQVAAEMQSAGVTGIKKFLAKTIGRGYAKSKLWEKTKQVENSQGDESRWSYEDGPSNLAGMDFYLDYYGGDSSQEIIGALDEFFGDAQVTKPEAASNWGKMQSTPQSKRNFKQNKSLYPATPEKEEVD